MFGVNRYNRLQETHATGGQNSAIRNLFTGISNGLGALLFRTNPNTACSAEENGLELLFRTNPNTACSAEELHKMAFQPRTLDEPDRFNAVLEKVLEKITPESLSDLNDKNVPLYISALVMLTGTYPQRSATSEQTIVQKIPNSFVKEGLINKIKDTAEILDRFMDPDKNIGTIHYKTLAEHLRKFIGTPVPPNSDIEHPPNDEDAPRLPNGFGSQLLIRNGSDIPPAPLQAPGSAWRFDSYPASASNGREITFWSLPHESDDPAPPPNGEDRSISRGLQTLLSVQQYLMTTIKRHPNQIAKLFPTGHNVTATDVANIALQYAERNAADVKSWFEGQQQHVQRTIMDEFQRIADSANQSQRLLTDHQSPIQEAVFGVGHHVLTEDAVTDEIGRQTPESVQIVGGLATLLKAKSAIPYEERQQIFQTLESLHGEAHSLKSVIDNCVEKLSGLIDVDSSKTAAELLTFFDPPAQANTPSRTTAPRLPNPTFTPPRLITNGNLPIPPQYSSSRVIQHPTSDALVVRQDSNTESQQPTSAWTDDSLTNGRESLKESHEMPKPNTRLNPSRVLMSTDGVSLEPDETSIALRRHQPQVLSREEFIAAIKKDKDMAPETQSALLTVISSQNILPNATGFQFALSKQLRQTLAGLGQETIRTHLAQAMTFLGTFGNIHGGFIEDSPSVASELSEPSVKVSEIDHLRQQPDANPARTKDLLHNLVALRRAHDTVINRHEEDQSDLDHVMQSLQTTCNAVKVALADRAPLPKSEGSTSEDPETKLMRDFQVSAETILKCLETADPKISGALQIAMLYSVTASLDQLIDSSVCGNKLQFKADTPAMTTIEASAPDTNISLLEKPYARESSTVFSILYDTNINTQKIAIKAHDEVDFPDDMMGDTIEFPQIIIRSAQEAGITNSSSPISIDSAKHWMMTIGTALTSPTVDGRHLDSVHVALGTKILDGIGDWNPSDVSHRSLDDWVEQFKTDKMTNEDDQAVCERFHTKLKKAALPGSPGSV